MSIAWWHRFSAPTGTGLSRPAGPRLTCPASLIASTASAGSPLACRIHASVTRPTANDGVWTNCRHSAMPSVACRSALSSSLRWWATAARPVCAGPAAGSGGWPVTVAACSACWQVRAAASRRPWPRWT
jgi:hypothetical protein